MLWQNVREGLEIETGGQLRDSVGGQCGSQQAELEVVVGREARDRS